MSGIGEELSVFLQALLAGSSVLLAYSCIRIVRRLVKHNLFVVSVEDFFFWIATGLYLFLEMYETSDGSIRWFFVSGVAAGAGFSYGILRLAEKLRQTFAEKHKKSIDKSNEKR